MNKRKFLLVAVAALVVSACSTSGVEEPIDAPTADHTEKATPASMEFMKGICYHPVPIGSTDRNFDRLTEDLALMKAVGINTIRTYTPILEREVLDEMHQAGMKVVMGFGYNQDGQYDILSGSFLDYIKAYKDHPAIAIWELGNEYNYHPEWFEGDIQNWYRALGAAAQAIHDLDSNLIVATAHGELPDSLALALCEDIDMWGVNIYRWDKPQSFYAEWAEVCGKPLYFSELGADSYMTAEGYGFHQGPNERAQAVALDSILMQTVPRTDVLKGTFVFSWTDGWWKAGNPDVQDVGGWAPMSSGVPYDGSPNEEYWGIVDIHRKPKLAYDVVAKHYLEEQTPQ